MTRPDGSGLDVPPHTGFKLLAGPTCSVRHKSVLASGRALLRKRGNLAAAGLTEAGWRQQWQAARLFLTADGEAGKRWGNETIRWHPGERWLELKLTAPLARLANRPHGRYRLACPVEFTYRGDEVAAQAATGAVRYDITLEAASGRWYLDASWTTTPGPAPALEELRRYPVVAVDVNAGHLAVRSSRPTATCSASRSRCRWSWPGCPPRSGTGGSAAPSAASSPLPELGGRGPS